MTTGGRTRWLSPRARRLGLRAAAVLGLAALGALIGLIIGLATPTHTEMAGNDVALRIVPGQSFDQVDMAGALTAKRATSRSVLGEPVGVRATVQVDAGYLFRSDGSVNSDVLPAYLQAFSDPKQLVNDVRNSFLSHVLRCVVIGAIAAALLALARHAYVSWRARTDGPDARARRVALAYRAPERRFVRRFAVALVVLVVLGSVPGAVRGGDPTDVITPSPILDDTPLAGTQLQGLLQPAIAAVESSVRTYFSDTDRYYDSLRDALNDELAARPVTLPAGPGVVSFGFVTDRHCNIGMDRVVVDIMKRFGLTTLVSAGDDDFSGSFSFESACTSNLADKTEQAGITDVVAAGNHDSATTLADERKQGMKVLDNTIADVGDLHFIGAPDPRSSRYGQGIQPSSSDGQRALLEAQGDQVADRACRQDQTLIAVLHDPFAGRTAMYRGCGKVVLALDGHTHAQAGPDLRTLPDGGTAAQFVGGSTGGAPNEHSIERTFASALTVGPLNNDASVNIVSYDTQGHRLVQVTVFHFTPDQQVSVEQLSG